MQRVSFIERSFLFYSLILWFEISEKRSKRPFQFFEIYFFFKYFLILCNRKITVEKIGRQQSQFKVNSNFNKSLMLSLPYSNVKILWRVVASPVFSTFRWSFQVFTLFSKSKWTLQNIRRVAQNLRLIMQKHSW